MSKDKSGGNAITRFLNARGYNTLDSEQLSRIATFLDWYKGFEKSFHEYTVRSTRAARTVQRYTLGMAKTVCEDFATLLLNEKVQITAEFPALPDILEDNNFMDRASRLVELTMALGTGAFVEFLGADGKPVIDYIRGDMIYPIKWDGDKITECAFGSVRTYFDGTKTKHGYYAQLHTKDESGQYVIENAYLDEMGAEVLTPDGVEPVSKPSPIPLFQIIRPNTVNSGDLDSPMGMSVYGACIDQLKACDLVFDSYVNEFVLGKKRMMVPQSMARLQMEADGTYQPTFDPSDALIYVYQQEQDGKNELKPVDMTLRTAEHETGIQRMVDMLSKRCGLGTGRYRFERDSATTATQVVSENSDLYQSLKRHEKPLERAIKGMVNALSYLSGGTPDVKTEVSFDDSVIEDVNATIQRNTLLVTGGLRTKKRAIMEIEHVDEKTAENMLAEIAKESTAGIGDVDVNGMADGGDGA